LNLYATTVSTVKIQISLTIIITVAAGVSEFVLAKMSDSKINITGAPARNISFTGAIRQIAAIIATATSTCVDKNTENVLNPYRFGGIKYMQNAI